MVGSISTEDEQTISGILGGDITKQSSDWSSSISLRGLQIFCSLMETYKFWEGVFFCPEHFLIVLKYLLILDILEYNESDKVSSGALVEAEKCQGFNDRAIKRRVPCFISCYIDMSHFLTSSET